MISFYSKMEAFVKYIEYNLLEKREKLSHEEINKVVQFNIKRKQILEQLIALLSKDQIMLGEVFEKISHNIGMYVLIPKEDKEQQCYITKDLCTNGRVICLCENIDQTKLNNNNSVQFYCRSDVVKYLRFFYFVTHFNFYVIMRIYETTVEERWDQQKLFFKDLEKKFEVAYTFLMELVKPLEYNHHEV